MIATRIKLDHAYENCKRLKMSMLQVVLFFGKVINITIKLQYFSPKLFT